MTKSIDDLVPFPVNAQRNSFFGALSSILLYRVAYTEDTPLFLRQAPAARIGMLSEHSGSYVGQWGI